MLAPKNNRSVIHESLTRYLHYSPLPVRPRRDLKTPSWPPLPAAAIHGSLAPTMRRHGDYWYVKKQLTMRTDGC